MYTAGKVPYSWGASLIIINHNTTTQERGECERSGPHIISSSPPRDRYYSSYLRGNTAYSSKPFFPPASNSRVAPYHNMWCCYWLISAVIQMAPLISMSPGPEELEKAREVLNLLSEGRVNTTALEVGAQVSRN